MAKPKGSKVLRRKRKVKCKTIREEEVKKGRKQGLRVVRKRGQWEVEGKGSTGGVGRRR